MSKNITNSHVKAISGMIRDWPKNQPLKWESICAGATSILGYTPTRQALHKKPAIKNAYEAKKKQLKASIDKLSSVARPQTILEAIERIANLQEENDLLKSELQKMAEVAQRFIHNASVAGLSRSQLNAPLPSKKT